MESTNLKYFLTSSKNDVIYAHPLLSAKLGLALEGWWHHPESTERKSHHHHWSFEENVSVIILVERGHKSQQWRMKRTKPPMTNNVDSYPTQLSKINIGILWPSRGKMTSSIVSILHRVQTLNGRRENTIKSRQSQTEKRKNGNYESTKFYCSHGGRANKQMFEL